MKGRIVAAFGAALLALASFTAHAQALLTTRDYDEFLEAVVMKAKNGSKEEWLASYDPVVNFISRVRQDVDKLPDAKKQVFAREVHNIGYWKGQQARVLDPANPFLSVQLKGTDDALKAVLTPQGFEAWRNRYAQGSRGYRFTLEIVADRAAFYRLQGKSIANVSELAANTTIINANAQSWDDLVADARNYPNPGERAGVIVGNQLSAVASALALMRGSKTLTDSEMDYATAVVWRYTGHFSGKDGWDKVPVVGVPYGQLPEAEKAKDRPIWKAVQEALKANPL